jgi:triosephosphate isomerase
MRPLIAANWKMHKNTMETQEFFEAWWKEAVPESVEAAFFPPYPLLPLVKPLLDGDESLGAQSCHEEDAGAYTGEVSCDLLKDVGCRYVLVGHSERRQIFKEGDGLLAAKFRTVLRNDLRPVLCVGELLEQREAGKTLEVVEGQLLGALGDEPPSHGFDVAYEPIWAIGTGKVATPTDAEEVHDFIRKWLVDREAGEEARILYGGSVKPSNARELMAVPEIQGVLVGGASLDPHSFASIARAGG